MPARFRERLGQGFILTIGRTEQCLLLYPSATWEQVSQQMDEAAEMNEDHWRAVRFINLHTEEAECDSQGRLFIPSKLRDFAGLVSKAVTIGNQRRVEVWEPERLAQQSLSPEELSGFSTRLRLN